MASLVVAPVTDWWRDRRQEEREENGGSREESGGIGRGRRVERGECPADS